MNNDIKEVENQTSNPILDIVTSIQSKLNESNSGETNISKQNINSPNLNNLDISKIVDMLNTDKTTNSMNANSNTNSSSPLGALGNLDIGSIMKFQNVLSGINNPDPRQNLLSSLKPFLRETRQKNIDTYIALLGVMKAFNIFNGKDRD
ncbi:MAG: hypothetical protein IKL68_01760 [Clostridia bacterium]|nr:hypothetical protein [Clostridia bacterium]